MMDYVRLVKEPIALEPIMSFLTGPEIGAVATFVGVVRARGNGENIQYLEYEAYPEMALNTIAQICAEVRERFPTIRKVAIVHRIGQLAPGEQAVVIGVCAAHRDEVFAALAYAVDRLKEIVPIWKKEVSEKGARWKTG